MSLVRALICIVLPPLAVVDRGCGTLLIVTLLTLAGWVPGVIAALDAPAGAYNLADDLPASQNTVVEEACRLLGIALPPLLAIESAGLSAPARAFYAESRRVANGKARRVLGWRLKYPTYREGLAAIVRPTSPSAR